MCYNYFSKIKLSFTMLALLLALSTFAVESSRAEDLGPQNYCFPQPESFNLNSYYWCYPAIYATWGPYVYYTVPILETQIIDASSGEIKMDRISRTNVPPLINSPWEGCYKYTGVKGEMEPGGTFRVKTWNDFNYYSYNGNDYCYYFAYGWYYYYRYFHRIFIDYNMDGDFEDPGEWINSPTNITTGATKKINGTFDWQFWDNSCYHDKIMEYEFKVPDNQKNGVTRMRIMNTLDYYWDPIASEGTAKGQGGNSCWNGYFYDYSYYYGPGYYYGYNYGEIEDYLIDFTIAIKGCFPDNKAPYDILLANNTYDGSDANHERAYVKFGQPQPSGTLLTYKIVGPLPSTDVVYEGVDPVTGSNQINIGADVIGNNVRYNILKARGPAVVGDFGFKRSSGGEYQLIMGVKKTTQPDFKLMKRNFSVSWEWDLAASNITRPLSNGEPRYYKYPRNLSMDLQGEVQNVGLRGIAKFKATYTVYNSKGEIATSREIPWDTANFGQFVVAAKQKVALDFGTWKTDKPDIYKVYLTVDLQSAKDMETFNDKFTRPGDPAYTFEVRDEIQAVAYSINVPKQGSEIIAGRPFSPTVDLKNEGVGDITNCPTTITVTDSLNKIVFTQTINVQDIPSGRYNTKSVKFDQKVIQKAGTYKMTLEVNHPDDLVKEDNKIDITFKVTAGLKDTWTIGLKNKGQINNFETIDAALDALFLRGLIGSIVFEFTDAEYTVSSRNSFSPAWDMSTAIMNLGFVKETGTYNTITFKPSIDRGVTRGSVKINLQSANGIGVFLGQSMYSSNSNSVLTENTGYQGFLDFCNSGGFITFDGGPNQSLRFILNSKRDAFGAVFYLNPGSLNMTIKNIIMENANINNTCRVDLPNVTFSVVDGFVWTPDEYGTETGFQGYSAGIVNRAKVLALKNESIVIALDTIPNENNSFVNNDISGFGYGIVSYGIGPLRVPEFQENRPFYNKNTLISGNRIYNVTGAGVVVGHEQNCKVTGNVIFDVNGNCGSFAAGIIAGGNSNQDQQGYNNMSLSINANQISNIRGNNAVYGIFVDQDGNKYPVGAKFQYFPDRDDDIMVTNNSIFDIKAKTSSTIRFGIHAVTERDHQISDVVNQLLTPRNSEMSIKKLLIANNTILLAEDGLANNGNIAGIGIQQTYGAKVYNNAVAITDGNINPNNLIASAIFYQGVYPKDKGGLIADRNAYWVGGSNASAYRHIYNDWKNRIIEIGTRNEYLNLEQWQMASRGELNSVPTGNFTTDLYYTGTYPAELKVKSTVKGSVLSKRGDRFPMFDKDIYGVIRGQAGSRYDIGAIEFNGSLYNRDAEMLVITAPGTYRATDGLFNDAEYTMTDAPVEIKALVRNSGNLAFGDKKIYAKIYRETPSGSWAQEGNTIEAKVDINENEHYEVNFKLADGVGDEFVPKTYNDLSTDNYTVPPQFLGMTPNVTPRYRIVVSTDVDEFNANNSVEKIVRFYIRRSSIKLLVSNQSYVDTTLKGLSVEQLATGLNKLAIDNGMKRLGWEIQLANSRYDYDVFQRTGWEPRNVNYSNYRTLLWSDGNENTLTRLQKLDLTNYVNSGSYDEKKNTIIMSQEMVRLNTNVDDPDEVFVRDILRGENRFPGNPLGKDQSYAGYQVTGVALAREMIFDIKSTGVKNDANPMPGLMNIKETGDGISRMAIRYNNVQNKDWTDEARIGGIGTSNLTSTILYVGIDWRHFGDIETLLRGSFDFAEGSGGVVIPVELLSFDAQKSGKRVDISWSTASENNSSKFEIEKAEVTSTGKGMFTIIDEMPAAGTSKITKLYGPIVDNNVEFGNSYYYRLKMSDRDGKSAYSEERLVTFEDNENMISVLPNPVTSISRINYSIKNNMNFDLKLYDAQGKEIMTLADGFKNAGLYSIELNAANLVSGIYTIVLKSGEILQTQKINVVK